MDTHVQKLNRYYIRISDEYGKLTVYWLRPVSAKKESLYTVRTKHRFYEMQYILSGSIDFRLSERDIKVREGEFLLVPPGVFHEITDFDAQTEKLIFAFDVVLFDDVLAEGLHRARPDICRESDTLSALAGLLIRVGAEPSMTAGIQVKCLLEAFFFELLRLVIPDAAGGPSVYKKRKNCQKQDFVNELVTYIRSCAGKGFVTVGELADAFHIGRRQLARICMETVGKTPRQIIDEERLQYIRELLSMTDCTLREIAYLSGFASEYSLSRFFREKEGYAPGQYRKYSTQ